jgi:hypothetical protein
MNSFIHASNTPGKHEIFINSKTPLTESYLRRFISPRFPVKIKIEGPRVLWDDVKGFYQVHIIIFIITGGLSLLGYLGFWLYEKWKPLYIVTLEVGNQINPLFELKIDT